MASYPHDYDSFGEIRSIEFHDHAVNAVKLPHKDLNFPMPSGLTVIWKNGHRDSVVNLRVLGVGNARVVLGGIDVGTNSSFPYVFKLQGWRYHHDSNGYEHWIVSKYIRSFARRFFGCVQADYIKDKKMRWEKTHTISVSVV